MGARFVQCVVTCGLLSTECDISALRSLQSSSAMLFCAGTAIPRALTQRIPSLEHPESYGDSLSALQSLLMKSPHLSLPQAIERFTKKSPSAAKANVAGKWLLYVGTYPMLTSGRYRGIKRQKNVHREDIQLSGAVPGAFWNQWAIS